MGHGGDAIAELTTDHREVEELFGKALPYGDTVADKQLAPTLPHPSAPDTPPANKLPAPGVGMVDRIRKVLTGPGWD
ncbi:hypothetical protein DMH25_04560 [Streptomyces sp. WAC 01325]|uniref:hypothetical protein n=1 Tax=Streptomyces sp. WAC 01325 TaxID=2203202 RepID=UPI000F8854D4|nr:hypothetical protein [Streptomyces sp. WAC 01325]RSN17028.1 hypothetical protein DMH25_04560 [Streptomyces sp. WAC 01325]